MSSSRFWSTVVFRRNIAVEFSSAAAQVGLILRESLRPTNDGLGAWAAIAIDGSEGLLWGRERSPGSDIKRHRNTRQLTRQCHRAEPFAGRLPYQARRDRIALSCKPFVRRQIHLRGSLVPGSPAQGPVAFQFGEEPVFECRGRPLVFRILESDCPGFEN